MGLLHHIFSRTAYRAFLVCALFVVSSHAGAATMSLPTTSSTGNFTISWTGGHNWVDVYESVNGTSVRLATGGPNSSYNVTGKPNGTYVYYIVDCTSNQYSSPTCVQSPIAQITVSIPHIPAPPTAVSAVVRQNVIFVAWSNNDNATSARLTRNGTQISSAASSPYTDASVIANTVYTYGVSACNVAGCSAVVSSPPVTAGVMQAGVKVVEGYVYNALGRLTKVQEDGALKTQYDYDNAGNRKQVNE